MWPTLSWALGQPGLSGTDARGPIRGPVTLPRSAVPAFEPRSLAVGLTARLATMAGSPGGGRGPGTRIGQEDGRSARVPAPGALRPRLAPLSGAEILNGAVAGLRATDPPARYRFQISHASPTVGRRIATRVANASA
jgi:hypothetical protein